MIYCFYKFIIFRFVQILYSLETEHQSLTVVPPGTVDKLLTLEMEPCFCEPSYTNTSHSPGRDRAETIVEPPPPIFTFISQVI